MIESSPTFVFFFRLTFTSYLSPVPIEEHLHGIGIHPRIELTLTFIRGSLRFSCYSQLDRDWSFGN